MKGWIKDLLDGPAAIFIALWITAILVWLLVKLS